MKIQLILLAMKYMIILAAFIYNQAFSQQTQKTDSLKKVILKNSSIDEVHKAYCKLIDIELDNDIEYAETLINELFNYGKLNKCVKCDNSAYFFQGHLYERNFKINESLNSFEFSAKNALKIKDFKQFHDSYMWKIQILLSYKTNTDSIEKEFIRYEKIADSIQLNYGKPDFYFLKAYNYYNQGYLNLSLDFYKKAEKYLIDNKIKNFSLQTSILNNTAQIFKELKDKDKTNYYLEKALELARNEKDSLAIMNIILHKGVIETDFKNFKEAIPELQKSYHFFNRINHDYFKASSALYLSIAHYNLKNYDEAMKYNDIAEALYEGSPSQINLGEVIAYKILILLENNQNSNSLESLIEKLDTIFKNNEDNPSYLIALKAKILYKLNNNMPKEAFLVMQRKDSLENILQEKFNRNLLNELEIKYQTDKKEQEINLLKVENELAKKQKYLYIGLLLLVIIVGFSLFQLYRNKIKTAEKIKELNEFKSRFFANISHEFRTPLTLIKSPIQTLKSKIIEEEQQKQLALVDQNANRMLELVDQLLELSKLDSNVVKLKLE
ncbi:MAG: histidine kinase dimerization/phospho-acceptor domain-containing protein, partial [Flavobacterium sp.]